MLYAGRFCRIKKAALRPRHEVSSSRLPCEVFRDTKHSHRDWMRRGPGLLRRAMPRLSPPLLLLSTTWCRCSRARDETRRCHGKGSGQNGFRLSLRGYAPDWDHTSLTREFDRRRVSPGVAGRQLALRKPMAQRPTKAASSSVRTAGPIGCCSPGFARHAGPVKGEAEARRLEVLPGNRTLRPGQSQQLTVRAEFKPGQWRDVTWLSRFDSNDAGMAAVDANGLVRVLRHGETAIRVSFQTQVAVVIVTAPFEKPVGPETLARRNNFIDEHVFNKLGVLRIRASELCGDAAFLRRAFLDTIGVLPTPAEVQSFLADKRTEKRQRLVDKLLDRPEFVDHWACFWAICFRTARNATTTCAVPREYVPSTNGCANRWRPVGRGTNCP